MAGLQIEIYLLMAIGWWMGKTGRLSKQTWSQLTDLVIVVILPCAIIRSFQMDLSEDVLGYRTMRYLFFTWYNGAQRGMKMTREEMIKTYRQWVFRMSAYQMALSIIEIDRSTVAPPAGASYRDERSAYLAGEAYSIMMDPKMLEIVNILKEDEQVDPVVRRGCQLYAIRLGNSLSFPKEKFVAQSMLFNQAYDAWLKAKQNNDYSIFEPYLKKIIESRREEYSCRNSDLPLYDQMLQDYEPGMTTEKYDAFFSAVTDRLVPLIHKVTEAEQIDNSFLHQEYPIEGQKKFMEHLLSYLHFDPSWGYQNETEHPFTSWTCQNDCRTTTKYIHDDVSSAILSTIHEAGHAWYQHNIDPAFDGMILSDGVSCGMHESQSRLLENHLGRSVSFWKANYPVLQEIFPSQLKDVTLDQFVAAINVAEPSLVRTEADELTYPLHIAIRYEIEKGLFNGTISTEHLDETWNAMYEKYLGVKAEQASMGILQDVHWSSGSFGYFPTYALGSAYAAQFVHTMEQQIPVHTLLEENRFDEIEAWLKENIHRHGCYLQPQDILKQATGEGADVHYYLDYLCDKYTKLYDLRGE